MGDRYCFTCGKTLPPGGLAYRMTMAIAADYDGVITEDQADMYALLEKCLTQDPEALEADVYQEITIILCKACKDATVARIVRYRAEKREPEPPVDL